MNRIVGNVLIIDSAMGNNFVLDSAGILSSDGVKFMVNAIAVYQIDTTGSIQLTALNTASEVLFKYNWVGLTADSMGKVLAHNPSWFSFGQPQPMEDIKCPTVTAGTAYLYFV